jgi:Fusaric acid resistance protein-like
MLDTHSSIGPVDGVGELGSLSAVRAALQPARAAWAIRPALGVFVAAGLVAIGGAVSRQWHAVSLVYLGLTFSAVYTKWGTYRLRAVTLLGQAGGATAGLWLGSIPHTDPSRVAVAVAVGALAGTLGGLTPALTAAANMAVIGVAFGEFGQVDRSWSAEVRYYLIGAVVIGVVALGLWPFGRSRPARNLGARAVTVPTHARSLDIHWTPCVLALRRWMCFRSGWSWRPATFGGLRLGWCLGIATAVTVVVHQHNHSYWIPLTVAVLIRQDASIPVRTVNRLAGTLTGVLSAALLLLVLASERWIIAAVAAVAIGFAVAAAPRLYALTVFGMTCSTLLSDRIASVDPAYPALRLTDTFIGVAITIVFGHFLWPRQSRTESHEIPASGNYTACRVIDTGWNQKDYTVLCKSRVTSPSQQPMHAFGPIFRPRRSSDARCRRFHAAA